MEGTIASQFGVYWSNLEGMRVNWRLDTDSREPRYRQIARYFEQQIVSGQLLPGSALPTERELSMRLGINRSTVTAAYSDLRASGFVQSTQGSGTRVSETLWGDTPKRGLNWHSYVSGGSFVPTLAIVRRIREIAAAPDTVVFSRGELSADLLPSEQLSALLRELTLSMPLDYANPKGEAETREAISAHLKEQYRVNAAPDEILLTSGAQQALHLVTHCLLNPGDAVGLEGPSYAYSRSLFVSAGLRLFQMPMDEHGLIPEEVVQLYNKHKIRMVFVNPTYQNPTGTTLSLSRRQRLLELCEERRIPIVEDDPYSLLALEGAEPPPLSLKALSSGSGHVLYMGTLSKMAAPGFRAGWIVAPAGVASRLAEAKQEMDYGYSTILQEVTKLYLTSGVWQGHLADLRQALTRRRNRMLTALQEHLGNRAEWLVPQGGYYLWCKLNRKIPDGELVREMEAHRVAVMPGSVYGAEGSSLRLSYAREPENRIEEGIRRLAAVLRRL